jgi:hypothetical protein
LKKDKDLVDKNLKACPNCDWYLRYSTGGITTTSISGYVITCGVCKFSSGYFPTYEAAVIHWNFFKDLTLDIKNLYCEISLLKSDVYSKE